MKEEATKRARWRSLYRPALHEEEEERHAGYLVEKTSMGSDIGEEGKEAYKSCRF